jgi:hypothetical protein
MSYLSDLKELEREEGVAPKLSPPPPPARPEKLRDYQERDGADMIFEPKVV